MQFETAAGFLVRSGDWDQKEGCLEGEVEEVEQRSFNIITPTPVAESTGINDIAKDIEIPLIASHAVDEHDAVKSAKIDGSAGGVGIQKLCAEIVPSNVKEELDRREGTGRTCRTVSGIKTDEDCSRWGDQRKRE